MSIWIETAVRRFKLEANNKIRNFAFIVYKDSVSEEWETLLRDQCLNGYYIFHDRDVNSDGTIKKSHFHVLIALDGPRSCNSIKRLVSYLGGANGVFQEVNSLRGYARYLCHLDNPDKHKYDVNDVVSMGDGDYALYIQTDKDKKAIVKDIIKFCKENKIYSYANLLDYCIKQKDDWFTILNGYNGQVVRDYIKSRYWTDFNYKHFN